MRGEILKLFNSYPSRCPLVNTDSSTDKARSTSLFIEISVVLWFSDNTRLKCKNISISGDPFQQRPLKILLERNH
jgi:hypothetical protein